MGLDSNYGIEHKHDLHLVLRIKGAKITETDEEQCAKQEVPDAFPTVQGVIADSLNALTSRFGSVPQDTPLSNFVNLIREGQMWESSTTAPANTPPPATPDKVEEGDQKVAQSLEDGFNKAVRHITLLASSWLNTSSE